MTEHILCFGSGATTPRAGGLIWPITNDGAPYYPWLPHGDAAIDWELRFQMTHLWRLSEYLPALNLHLRDRAESLDHRDKLRAAHEYFVRVCSETKRWIECKGIEPPALLIAPTGRARKRWRTQWRRDAERELRRHLIERRN